MDEILNSQRIDRRAVTVGSLANESNDVAYWANASIEDRWAAMEFLRVVNYGYNPATDRLQRVLSVIDLKDK